MLSSQNSDPPDIRNWHPSYIYESINSEEFNRMIGQSPKKARQAKKASAKTANGSVRGAGVVKGRRPSQAVQRSDGGADLSSGKRSRSSQGVQPNQDSGASTRTTPSNQTPASPGLATVIGSTSGTPEDDVAGPVTKKKNGVRGPTKLFELTDVESGVKLPIRWGGLKGGPTGKNARKLSTLCGLIARRREFVPIQIIKFNKFLKDKRTNIDNRQFLFNLVCDHFEINTKDKHAEQWVISNIGNAYSEHLCDLKTRYFKGKTVEEAKLNLPPEVGMQDWLFLIAKWNSDEHQAISSRNSINRACVVSLHSSGSRSHDIVYDEEVEKNNGVAPVVYEFWAKVHTDKTGVPMDYKTDDIMSTMMEKLAAAEVNGIEVDKDVIFAEVMKDKDMSMPKKKTFSKSNPEDTARIDDLSKRLEEKEVEMDNMQEKYDGLKSELESFRAAFRNAGFVLPPPAREVVGSDDETQEN